MTKPTRFLAFVFEDDSEIISKEAGPSMFFQSHSLIVPSGSLEAEPSNEMLSVGKVITWSGPAIAVGGLLFSLQPSQDVPFSQELKNKIPAIKASNKEYASVSKKRFYGSIVFL